MEAALNRWQVEELARRHGRPCDPTGHVCFQLTGPCTMAKSVEGGLHVRV